MVNRDFINYRAVIILAGWRQVLLVKIIVAIFDFYSSGKLGKSMSGGQKEGGEGVGPFPAPFPTLHFNSKSNMAGRINDRDLLTLTPKKTSTAG